jgi:hypothetical protein
MWVVKIKGRFDLLFKAQNDRDRAIVLCAGDKSKDPKRFYRKMVAIADDEFASHLARLNEG